MAGRKPRLYDTVNKTWIDFETLQEADDLFKDKKRNPFVNTKEFGITNRYRYDEPVNNVELLLLTLGGKPKNPQSGASKVYKLMHPNVDLEKGQNAVGINPIWDRDYNFKKHPEWKPSKNSPIYYPTLDEYWGYNEDGEFTNKIDENVIGSAKRRKLQALSKDSLEEKDKWLSEYYNFISGGVDAMSPEAQDSYRSNYANNNSKLLAANPDYSPYDPYVFKARALTAVAGKGAIDKYMDLALFSDEAPIRLLSGLSNALLAEMSEKNDTMAELFDDVIDYFMLKYYGDIANKYKDDPINISLDIQKHGDYSKIKKSLSEYISKKVENSDSKLEKIGWGTWGMISSLGNSLINNLGVQVRESLSSDAIENKQRDRANNIVETVSDRMVTRSLQNYDGEVSSDASEFDDLAEETYAYYKLNDLDEVYSPELKRDLLQKYKIQEYVVGREKAQLNLLKELLNRDYKELGTIKRLGYTANNLFNTIGTTVGHIANMAFYAPQYVWDIGLATAGLFLGEQFWDKLGDELYDTWNRSLDNAFVNYLSDVESTGSWLPWDFNIGKGIFRSQDYYKKRGINANKILRDYGNEDTIKHWSTLYDVVPVTGYMIGSAYGAKGFNLVGEAMRGISNTGKVASRFFRMAGNSSSSGLASFNFGAASRGTSIASKFLGKGAKLVDATAPAMATAGMDYGYAKNNYDLAMLTALEYVESPEFKELVNDRINGENRRTVPEGHNYISSSLEDKISFALEDPNFRKAAEQFQAEHNDRASAEDIWVLRDAARELYLKPYKDEYLEEVEKLATFNAGLTFGLTILPDIHMTNTWRKAMFSAQSRGAMNALARNRFFKPIGKVLGIKPLNVTHIEGVYRKDGKWFVNGKQMELNWKPFDNKLGRRIEGKFGDKLRKWSLPISKDLGKIYLDLSKAGFISNYLQDVGVAAGNGLQEAMLGLYIDLRFGGDAMDGVSYDMTEAWIASADKAGIAFGDKTSFRDGLYGAIAPWILSTSRSVKDVYKGVKEARNKGSWSFAKSLIVEPILKNSLLYNVSLGRKEIVNKENLRRLMLHNTIAEWLNAKGDTYLDNIGNLLELSKLEKEAVKNGDFSAFNDSRLGLKVTAAIMLSLILNFEPIKTTIMAYMKDRANRPEVGLQTIDDLQENLKTLQALRELGDLDKISQFLELFDPKDRSILKDLIDIREYNQDSKTTDSRTEFLQLNDLRNSAKEILELMLKANKYYLEAEVKFGDSADLVVKLEYARLKLYLDKLQQDIKDKGKLLKDIESKIVYSDKEAAVNSTMPIDDMFALYAAEYGGSREKLAEGIEINRREVQDIKENIEALLEEIANTRKGKPKNDNEWQQKETQMQNLRALLNYYKIQHAIASLKQTYLNKLKKAAEDLLIYKEDDVATPRLAIIAAKDMLKLTEEARLQLLTSKKLSKALQEEVDKFKANIEFANDIEDTGVDSYIDLLSSKIRSTYALQNLAYEGELTQEAIERLNRQVAEARVNAARDLYARSFAGFAEESQYLTEEQPNVNVTETINPENGETESKAEVNPSLPTIAVILSELKSYEKFVKAYDDKVKELQGKEESSELLLGLDKALRDANNSLYLKMVENRKQSRKAQRDLNTYISPDVFSAEEKRELLRIIEFATVYRGIQADNIMQSILNLNDEFMSDLVQFLKDSGFTPGTIEDLKKRLLQYNHNITETIEKNKKAEEERLKKKELKPEVKKAKEEAAEKKVVLVFNAIATYTGALQDANMTPMRDFIAQLGFGDAHSPTYSINFLKSFRDVLINSEANTVEGIQEAIDLNILKLGENSETQLTLEELIQMSILANAVKALYFQKSGSFKTFGDSTPPPPPPGGNGSSGNSGNSLNLGGRLGGLPEVNHGNPYSLLLVRWLWAPNYPAEKRSYMVDKYLLPAHIDEFFRYYTVNNGSTKTLVVFISSNEWAREVADAINKKGEDKKAKGIDENIEYNEADARPILAAIEINSPRDGCLTIDNKHYQIIGMLPSTSKESNTAIIRKNATRLGNKNSNSDDYYLITEEVTEEGKLTEKLLSTTMSRPEPQSRQLDLDKGPQPIQAPPNKILSSSHFRVYNEEGKEVQGKDKAVTVKTNLTPSSERTSTDSANWAVVQILDMDATLNELGKSINDLEGDDVINFNSRTLGFAKTLQFILEEVQKNPSPSGIRGMLKLSLNTSKPTGLNSRIGLDENNTALAKYISLANDYSYQMTAEGENLNLLIVHDKNVVAKWTVFSTNPDNIITVDLIIKDISNLKYTSTQGEAINIGKWQVHLGNFNFTNGQGTHLKNEYVQQALKDKILYAYDVVPAEYDIVIDPVKDLLAEELLKLANLQVERQAAQQTLDDATDPVTGLLNMGVTIEGAIEYCQQLLSLDGEQKDAVIAGLLRLQAIKAKVEAYREKHNNRRNLAINQTKSGVSTVSTTAVVNGRTDPTPEKMTKQKALPLIGGNVVDKSCRNFFDPLVKGTVTKESFAEEVKEIFNETSVNNLWEALEVLNETFKSNGWHIISTGIYTVNEDLNDRPVGELDLLAIDSFGNPHIIDIKTYSTDEFNWHNYRELVSAYRYDVMRNTRMFVPEENLHIFALHLLNMNPEYYNMTTDANGVCTLTKKAAYKGKILIPKGTRFEYKQVKYVGDTKMEEYAQQQYINGLKAAEREKAAEELSLEEGEELIQEKKEAVLKEELPTEKEEIIEELSPEEQAEREREVEEEESQNLDADDIFNTKGTIDKNNDGCNIP